MVSKIKKSPLKTITKNNRDLKKTLLIDNTIMEENEKVDSDEFIDSEGLELEDDDLEIINTGDDDSIIEVGKTLIEPKHRGTLLLDTNMFNTK